MGHEQLALSIIISFMSESAQSLLQMDKEAIADCFLALHSTSVSPQVRKQANQRLLELEANPVMLLGRLLQIFESGGGDGLRLQALVYFCNVLKRNWQLRRYNKAHAEFEALKKDIRNKVVEYLCMRERVFLKTLFDMVRFIVDKDYPHHFPAFSQFTLKVLAEIDLSDTSVMVVKQLKQTFYQLGERKGGIAKKLFEENLRDILNTSCQLSIKLRDAVLSGAGDNMLTPSLIKLSKYADQIIAYTLRVAPADIMDEQFSQEVTEFLMSKLQALLTAHSACTKGVAVLLEKNIKSLIFDLGLLQLSKPLVLCWILPELFTVLVYVMQNHLKFAKNQCLRYSLIGLRRIVKEFSYYSEDSAFMSSIKSKTTSSNCLQLRRRCAEFYRQTFTPQAVEDLLNFLLFNPFSRSQYEGCPFDPQQGSGVDRGREKELTVGACVVMVIQGLLERFTAQTHSLITGLVRASLQNNWNNLDANSTGNLLSVVALLPGTCKRGDRGGLQEVPVLEVLQFIYGRPIFRGKFAGIVSGWLDAFTNSQLDSLAGVLLDFIGQAGAGEDDVREAELQLLMSCCQCLNKIVSQRAAAIDLRALVQRVLPVSLGIFQRIDSPEVLWPMVSLLSNVIVKVDFDAQLIVSSVDPSRLSLLVGNQSPTLVQALCEMFKSFLCVIPRQMAAGSVYQLVCLFLNNHLSQLSSVSHQKIFNLWYIAVREYSQVHGCREQYTELFQNHFKKNLFRKTATLVYILEEYVLANLVPVSVESCVAIAEECYIEAQGMQKEERDPLKIAALSFQITLITVFRLEQVNSDRLLRAILQDLGNFDTQIVSPTVRNSILSIINRYIALHLQDFLNYLATLGIPLTDFLAAYVRSMDSLTSNTATKINAIAVTSLLNRIDTSLLLPHLHNLLRLTIPEVERHISSLQSSSMGITFIGKVDNSPSLRFASNTLSVRKEEARRMDAFDKVDLAAAWRAEVGEFLRRAGATPTQVAQAFNDQTWANRFMRLI